MCYHVTIRVGSQFSLFCSFSTGRMICLFLKNIGGKLLLGRCDVQFLMKLKKNVTQIYRMLQQVYGTKNEHNITFVWVKQFQDRRKYVIDNESLSHPTPSRTVHIWILIKKSEHKEFKWKNGTKKSQWCEKNYEKRNLKMSFSNTVGRTNWKISD